MVVEKVCEMEGKNEGTILQWYALCLLLTEVVEKLKRKQSVKWNDGIITYKL